MCVDLNEVYDDGGDGADHSASSNIQALLAWHGHYFEFGAIRIRLFSKNSC